MSAFVKTTKQKIHLVPPYFPVFYFIFPIHISSHYFLNYWRKHLHFNWMRHYFNHICFYKFKLIHFNRRGGVRFSLIGLRNAGNCWLRLVSRTSYKKRFFFLKSTLSNVHFSAATRHHLCSIISHSSASAHGFNKLFSSSLCVKIHQFKYC